jgi:hypothetical protein
MTPNNTKTSVLKLVTLTAGVIVSTGLLYGSFKWGVYYASNTSKEKVLSKDERGVTITEASVKVMHGPDMVPYAIWHKDYLYTPDTAMMDLIGGSRHP